MTKRTRIIEQLILMSSTLTTKLTYLLMDDTRDNVDNVTDAIVEVKRILEDLKYLTNKLPPPIKNVNND